jgi:polygalacturonase
MAPSAGGRVVLPAGTWLSKGPIEFKSDVELHLKAGATLRFSTTPADYLPMVLTKFEGTLLYNYSPLIRGYLLTNVALTGEPGSVIDGQGQEGFSKWRGAQKSDQNKLRQMGNDTVPHYQRVFGPAGHLRPVFVQFFGCRNVLIEGVTLIDSPFWVVHPTFCTNVIVRGVTVNSPHVNNDGVDPDASVDVLVEGNNITSGDDCVAIKAGRDADAWQLGQPTRNVIVRNNVCNGPG